MRTSDNLRVFHDVIERAYRQEKSAGRIPAQDVSVYDQLIACPAVVYNNQQGRAQLVHAHKQWRRRVYRMYQRSQGRPLRGLFDFDFDWEEIWNWILENIVPILKLLLIVVPFFIL